jgi:lipopolysaccharide export system protein LptA
MIAKRINLIVFIIIITMSTCAWAQTGFDRKNMMRKNEPIEIVSDKMEAFQEKKMVVFSGNVVATQGDTKLKTDHLIIYYKGSNNKKDKIGKQDLEAAGNLDKIELKGNVIITQKEMSATGEEAVYYQESAQFVMTGNPVLRQGKNVIKGCKVVVYNDENRGKVEQCEKENSGRVTAIIHTQDKK